MKHATFLSQRSSLIAQRAACFVALVAVAACGGGGGGGAVPQNGILPSNTGGGPGATANVLSATATPGVGATATPKAAATTAPVAVTIPSAAVSTQGTDVGARTGGFTLDQGYPNGKIPVTVGTSALQIGGTAATNVYVQVTGTGSVHSGVTATVLTYWSAAPSTVTVTGTIASATSYGFTLNVDSTHTAVPIILHPGVVVAGGTLQTGSLAQVTGPGSTAKSITPVQIVVTNPTPAPSPNVTPTPTPGPISQKHVLTADYLGGYYGTRSISWSTAAQYLNWASTNQNDANAISAAGIKTMYYTNPNRVQSGDPMYTSDETTFAHDCNNNRITTVFNGITQYVTNVQSSSLATLYHNTIASKISGAHFDAMFEDNAGLLEEYGITPLSCNYTDAGWSSGASSVGSAAPAPVIFNGLSSLNGHNVSPIIPWVNNPNTLGGTFEHCLSDDAQAEQNGWMWQATENTELQVAARKAIFVCMLRNTSAAQTQTAARLYATASFLLAYDPSTSVLWEGFGTTSGFHVMPESQLVVLNPKTATPSDISGLLTSGGAYGREYNDCYISGNFVGPCAIAVNSDPTNQKAFPYPQYTHTLVISGSGIADGGTLATNGPAAPMYMPAMSAVIAFP